MPAPPMLSKQLLAKFGESNLRCVWQMDNDGYIPLGMVANFNRVRMLTPDPGLIVEALQDSTVVELSKDGEYVRVSSNHQQWVLPPQQRDLAHKPRPAAVPEAPKPDGGDGGDDDSDGEDMFQLDEVRHGGPGHACLYV